LVLLVEVIAMDVMDGREAQIGVRSKGAGARLNGFGYRSDQVFAR
jgi:hypothetical protein